MCGILSLKKNDTVQIYINLYSTAYCGVLILFEANCWTVSESPDKIDDDQEDDEVGFEGTPKPMLPYSSLFIFGPTNPYLSIYS